MNRIQIEREFNINGIEVFFFNVGLGECAFFISNGKTMLIDGGSFCCNSLKVLLKKNNINCIDYLICTHAHEDHVDGLAELAEFISFGKVYCNINDFPKSKCFSKLKQIVYNNGNEIIIPNNNDKISFGTAEVEFLSPGNNIEYKTGNDRSLTCMVRCGERKIFMTADVGNKVISDWINNGVNIKADVLKLPHHGLASCGKEFLNRVNPEIAVISYGKNDYGPICETLLDELNEMNIETLRTDLMGNIHIKIENNNIEVETGDFSYNFEGKKLLLLGANSETIKFVKKAQDKGLFVIVTDNIVNSPAKKIANKYYDVNGIDYEGIHKIILDENVDGVLVAVADVLIPTYMKCANSLFMPYLPDYSKGFYSGFFTDKRVFKEECASIGLNVIPQYYTGNDSDFYKNEYIEYPCIVKPMQGRGGRGVAACKNEDELHENFLKAQRYSDNGQVIVEKMMDCPDIIANYFFCDGIPYLIAVSDRKTLKSDKSISPVTFGNVYPSSLTEVFKEKCGDKFISLFRKLNIRNGILEIQIFWDGKEFYPYDPATILGGELSSPIFSKVLGIDLIDSFINYAMTGNMQCNSVPSDGGIIPNNYVAESVWILLKPGKISKIEGINELNSEYILEVLQRLNVGDEVSDSMFQTEKSTFARIWIYAKNKTELQKLEEDIRNTIKVYGEDGKSMIWDGNN